MPMLVLGLHIDLKIYSCDTWKGKVSKGCMKEPLWEIARKCSSVVTESFWEACGIINA